MGDFLRALVCLPILLLLGGASGADSRRTDTARELEAVQDRIKGLESEVARAAAAKPSADKALKEAELTEAEARRGLQEVRAELARGKAREQKLREERERAENDLQGHRRALDSQLRLAYIAGREEWLRLALAQQDPAALSRRVVYYGYFTRQRRDLLEQVQQELQALDSATVELGRQLAALADLEQRQQARLKDVGAARQARVRALDTLQHQLESREQKLARLRRDARSLSDLMGRLERERRAPASRAKAPAEPGPPQRLKDLPLRGQTVARFGQPRAEGLLRWDGLMLAAPAGAEVRAVRAGRVVYSDWLPGMGLLLVVDHGGGYMSLYGHNQNLLKEAGDPVSQGEVISLVGDSGGQGAPALYFELRRNGKPVDPAGWVR